MTTQTASTETKALAALADEIAPRIRWDRNTLWGDLRDSIDGRTGGELECVPLDILTDIVAARIKRETGHVIPRDFDLPTPRRRKVSGFSALRVDDVTRPE